MVENKAGAASVLKHNHQEIEIMGCSCHLINLAAEKDSACLPFKIGEILVDTYLQNSNMRLT